MDAPLAKGFASKIDLGPTEGPARKPPMRLAGLSGVFTDDNKHEIPRLWAQRRIESLLTSERDDAKAEVTQLGMDHFLVTPYTSLLVLENEKLVGIITESDFVRYVAELETGAKAPRARPGGKTKGAPRPQHQGRPRG